MLDACQFALASIYLLGQHGFIEKPQPEIELGPPRQS